MSFMQLVAYGCQYVHVKNDIPPHERPRTPDINESDTKSQNKKRKTCSSELEVPQVTRYCEYRNY